MESLIDGSSEMLHSLMGTQPTAPGVAVIVKDTPSSILLPRRPNKMLPTAVDAAGLHVFQELDETLYQELKGKLETVKLPPGQVLFKVGAADQCAYIVLSGSVLLSTAAGPLSSVTAGETCISLLSLLDVVSGGDSKYKTLTATAGAEGALLHRLPGLAIKSAFASRPELLQPLMRIVGQRLQRVTILTLVKVFGLDAELLAPSLPPSSDLVVSRGRSGTAAAIKLAAAFLGLNPSELRPDVAELCEYAPGQELFRPGLEKIDLFYVLRGEVLESSNGVCDNSAVRPGEVAGIVGYLAGQVVMFSGIAGAGGATVLRIDSTAMNAILAERPACAPRLAQILLSRLSSVVRQADFAIQVAHFEAGEPIFAQGEDPHSFYVVLSGRARSVANEAAVVQE